MPLDYARIAANAAVSIKNAGAVIPVYRENRTFDPATSKNTEAAPTTGEIIGVVLPAGRNPFVRTDEQYREELLRGSIRMILAAEVGATLNVQQGDFATFDGADWEILGVTPLSPAGVNIINKIAVRKK